MAEQMDGVRLIVNFPRIEMVVGPKIIDFKAGVGEKFFKRTVTKTMGRQNARGLDLPGRDLVEKELAHAVLIVLETFPGECQHKFVLAGERMGPEKNEMAAGPHGFIKIFEDPRQDIGGNMLDHVRGQDNVGF